jgi:hypothetical protein
MRPALNLTQDPWDLQDGHWITTVYLTGTPRLHQQTARRFQQIRLALRILFDIQPKLVEASYQVRPHGSLDWTEHAEGLFQLGGTISNGDLFLSECLAIQPPFTCGDCQHARIELPTEARRYGADPGDPGDPGGISCSLDEYQEYMGLAEALNGLPENAAPSCHGFRARITEACAYCKSPLNIPSWSAPFRVGNPWSDTPLVACSDTCKHALELKIEQELADEAAMLSRIDYYEGNAAEEDR